jgi:hypothetical protein
VNFLGRSRFLRPILCGGVFLLIVAGLAALAGGLSGGVLALSGLGRLPGIGLARGGEAFVSRYGSEGLFWRAFMLAASIPAPRAGRPAALE